SKPDAGQPAQQQAPNVALATPEPAPPVSAPAPAPSPAPAVSANVPEDNRPQAQASAAPPSAAPPSNVDMPAPESETIRTPRLYFGVETDGGNSVLRPWAPGEEPVRVTPDVDAQTDRGAEAKAHVSDTGETIAAKGEVTGADRRPKTPAELLHLTGKDR